MSLIKKKNFVFTHGFGLRALRAEQSVRMSRASSLTCQLPHLRWKTGNLVPHSVPLMVPKRPSLFRRRKGLFPGPG